MKIRLPKLNPLEWICLTAVSILVLNAIAPRPNVPPPRPINPNTALCENGYRVVRNQTATPGNRRLRDANGQYIPCAL